MRDWEQVYKDIEKKYPEFRKWIKEDRGYLECASLAQIKSWYRYLEFEEKVKNESNLHSGEVSG